MSSRCAFLLLAGMIVTLVCPDCRKNLTQVGTDWRCHACGKTYGGQEGVLNFLGASEVFNPGAYEAKQKNAWSESARLRSAIHQSTLLSLLNDFRIRCSLSGRRDRVFLKSLVGRGKEAVILDVGCGGGRHYFCRFGRVVGIDPVLDLLLQARNIYSEVYLAGGFALPFADESFDFVVSSDLIGHIREADKDRLFAEIYRVLKKGGRTAHVIETDACNPWFRFAHRHPELYQKYFVDRPGHYGLELPTQLRERFLKHGFKPVLFRKMGSRVQEVGFLTGAFGNEFRAKSRWISFLVGLDGLLVKSLLVREMLNLLLEPLAWLDDALTPLDYGSGILAVFQK